MSCRTGIVGGGSGPITVDNMQCTGSEASIYDCNKLPDFRFQRRCWAPDQCTQSLRLDTVRNYRSVQLPGTDLRLVNGASDTHGRAYSGRLEIYHSGVWGTICDDAFDICIHLGFASGVQHQPHFEQGAGNMDNPGGPESIVFSCAHNACSSHNCGEDAGVT